MGEPVEFADGSGYLATGEGAGPALIVVGEPGGSVAHLEDVCERFAAEGFTALAPLLRRDLDDAAKAASAFELEQAARDLSSAVDFLLDHGAVRGQGVGVIGFSLGAGVALSLASIRADRVRAVVPFYGGVGSDSAPPDVVMTAAVEGHQAEHDDPTRPEAVGVLEETSAENGRDVRMFVYPGTSPGFFDDTRPEVYDDDAARQAWVRTLEFLRAKLG